MFKIIHKIYLDFFKNCKKVLECISNNSSLMQLIKRNKRLKGPVSLI